MKYSATFFMLLSFLATAQAQETISIATQNTQMLLSIDKENRLKYEYYGKKLEAEDDLMNAGAHLNTDAYPAFGLNPDRLMAIRATHADGDLTLVLKYLSHEVKKMDDTISMTTIHLKDEKYPFYVDLNYKVFKAEDVIESWTEISHQERKPITLHEYASAYLSFNAPEAYLTHFHGNFGTEFTQQETQLKDGTFVIEDTEGIRNSTQNNASFFLSLNSEPSEDEGDVVAGSLAWTGNYKIKFTRDAFKQLQLTAGINNYASDYVLDKGKTFVTPPLILTYSNEGKGKASRNLHRYARNHKMVDGGKELKILLNSWEGVHMDFNEDDIVGLIDDSAKLGVELFVLDDGWFGNKYVRDNGGQGLGDWQVAQKKLPHGIEYLIDACEERGIEFGIWVEPEMVNTTSELYEKHPDWVLQNTDRELIAGRGKTQVVLDLSNPKVQDFVFNTVNDLLDKHPRIDYIKWDANATLANYGSTYLPRDRQSQLYFDFHLGLQNVFKRLRENHPHTVMQACASGGGRTNYGYLQYFNEFWPSDNTDALQRIYTQWGMSHVFPSMTIASHVSKSPSHQTKRIIPIKFRFDVAMTGRLGIEMQPKDMTEEEREFSRSAIEVYKDIRPIVQFGDLYRILSPYKDKRLSSLMYVDEERQHAVFFGFCSEKINREKLPFFKMKGLDTDARYRVTEINKEGKGHFEGSDKVYFGCFLMETGLDLNIQNEYDSVVLKLSRMQE